MRGGHTRGMTRSHPPVAAAAVAPTQIHVCPANDQRTAANRRTSLSIIASSLRLMNTGFPRHLKMTLVPGKMNGSGGLNVKATEAAKGQPKPDDQGDLKTCVKIQVGNPRRSSRSYRKNSRLVFPSFTNRALPRLPQHRSRTSKLAPYHPAPPFSLAHMLVGSLFCPLSHPFRYP